MRIALVATHHAEYAANLALAMATDHEVLLILSERNAHRQLRAEAWRQLSSAMTLKTVPHHYAPLQPLIARMCLHHLRAFRPDIVHVQEHPTRSTYWLAKAIVRDLPIVATIHDPTPHSGGDARAAETFRAYNGRLRLLADGLIVHGRCLAQGLRALLPDDAGIIRPIPHGALRFGALAAPAEMPEPDPRRLIFFGRMEQYKGLDLLLDANDRWLASNAGISLVVAGSGPEIGRLGQRLNDAPNITLHSHRLTQEHLAGLVAGAAAAILPYHDATQSGVAASALGGGLPVIATDVGALAEVILDGGNGLIVPKGDVTALAAAGSRLVGDIGLQSRLRAGARETVEGRLSWSAIAAETAGFYRDLCLHRRTGSETRPG